MAEPRTTPDLPRRIHILEEKQYAKQRAGDLAAEQIEHDKASLTGVVGFCKRYIRHNLLEDYTRQKKYYEQLDKINNEGNPYSAERGEDPRAFDHVVESVLKRFDFEREEEANIYLKQGLGETRTKLEKTDQRHTRIVQIISNYAEGLIADEATLSEIISTEVLPAKDKSNENSQYMHDIISVANTVRANIDQYRALGRLEDVLEVYVGNAVIGTSTESYQTRVDKIVEWIGNKKILNVISQETLASALTIASTIAVQGSTRLAQGVGFSAGSVFGSALVGGAIGGLRDRTRFNRELRQHMRDKVQGRQAVDQGPNSKRAKFEQERTLFQTKDATVLVTELETAIADYTALPNEVNLNTMLRVLGESRARTHFEEYGFAKHKDQIQPGEHNRIGTRIDLISYPDVTQVSTLNDRIRDLQATITRTIRNSKDSDSIIQQRIPGNLDEYLDHVKQVHMANLTMGDSGIAKTVERIEKMRGRRSRKTAGVGAVVGTIIGEVGQELHALASSSKVGILEDLYSRAKGENIDLSHKDQTLLEQLLNKATGRRADVGVYDQHLPVNERVEFTFDKGTTITKNASGSYDITQNGQTVHNLHIDAKGQLDPASIRKLENYDIKFHTEAGPSIQTTQTKNTLEYLADIQDNPKSKYHEFANDVKVINRNYSEDQLVYGHLKIGWEFKNGEFIGHIPAPSTKTQAGADIFRDPGVLRTMKVVLTVNGESGHKVVEVPVQAVRDGFEVRVSRNHPAFWLFEKQGTSVEFKGLQAELAQKSGTANKDAIYNFFGRETNAKGIDEIKEVITDSTTTKGVKIVIEATEPNQPWNIPGSYVVNPIQPMGETKQTIQTVNRTNSQQNNQGNGSNPGQGSPRGEGSGNSSGTGESRNGYGERNNNGNSNGSAGTQHNSYIGGYQGNAGETYDPTKHEQTQENNGLAHIIQEEREEAVKHEAKRKEKEAERTRQKQEEEKAAQARTQAEAEAEQARTAQKEQQKKEEARQRAAKEEVARQAREQAQKKAAEKEQQRKEKEARMEKDKREEAEKDIRLSKEYNEWKAKIKQIQKPAGWDWSSPILKKWSDRDKEQLIKDQAPLAYMVLDLPFETQGRELIRKFRELSLLYHPDTITAYQKMPNITRYKKIAEENFKLVSAAKEKIDQYSKLKK